MKAKRKMRLEIRLSEDEQQLFLKKAQSYAGNMSALIRDAVSRYDDQKSRGKLETMSALLSFYKTFQQQLSWLGGNFNQSMHRANELAISGELSPEYFHNVLVPKTGEAIQVLREIKSQLDAIHEQLDL
jgi:hypothetical protein